MVKPAFGAARIATNTNGTYEPDSAGEYAAIIAVRDAECDLVDLCAWFPDRPGHWWLRYRDECFFMGARALAVAAYFGDPIELHGTPQEWALAGGKGACLLRWDINPRPWFEGVDHVECAPELAKRLRETFHSWEPTVGPRRYRDAA